MRHNRILSNIARMLWCATMVFCSPASAQDIQEIHKAAGSGDMAKVKLLLKSNPELVKAVDNHSATPLHHAVNDHQKAVVEVLLANKADINVQDDAGRTPLFRAVSREAADMVEFLVAHKADVNIKSKAGTTPLKVALLMNQTDVAKLLRKHGAKEE